MCTRKHPSILYIWQSVALLIVFVITLVDRCGSINTNGAGGGGDINEFRYCLRQSQHPNLRECIGRSAISFLHRFNDRENITLLEDFVVRKDDTIASRSLVNMLDTDPVDFRGILENAGAVISQRSLQWHMDTIYPGLMLRVGPTGNTNSLVEFVLDPNVSERQFGFEEPSTARVLAKQYLLPFLLGLKFNLVALVPLLFAGVCLLLKKSLFFAKLAIYVSGLLGVGGVAGTLSSLGAFSGIGGIGGFGGPHIGGLVGPPPIHGHSLDSGGGASGGYFPGKATVYNHQYADSDELHHNSPYKRTDRKLNFNKPREDTINIATPGPVLLDHFYDYEKKVLLQDRSGKMRGRLGPSAAFERSPEDTALNFKSQSERLGWKVAEVREQ